MDDENLSLSLDYFNEYDYDNSRFEFHGTLNFEPTESTEKFLDIGFCIKSREFKSNWDCFSNKLKLSAETN